jgi:hypothetical protein
MSSVGKVVSPSRKFTKYLNLGNDVALRYLLAPALCLVEQHIHLISRYRGRVKGDNESNRKGIQSSTDKGDADLDAVVVADSRLFSATMLRDVNVC